MSDQHGQCHEGVSPKGQFQPCDLPAVAMRIDAESNRPYPVCIRHTRKPMLPLAILLSRITDKGAAVIESGLTLRQAHEIQTGCSPEHLCDECESYLT